MSDAMSARCGGDRDGDDGAGDCADAGPGGCALDHPRAGPRRARRRAWKGPRAGASAADNGWRSRSRGDARAGAPRRRRCDFDEAVAAAGLVVESGPEDMEWKQELFARMDALTRPTAVLASNTSGLSITAIASRCARPERVLTTHFWNPPHLMPLVEIVKGEKTSDEVAQAVRDLLAACGKTPVVVKKDRPGQLGQPAADGAGARGGEHRRGRNRGRGGRRYGGQERLRPPHAGVRDFRAPGRGRAGSGARGAGVRGAGSVQRAAGAGVYAGSGPGRASWGADGRRVFTTGRSKSAEEVRARRDAFLVEVLRYRAKG